MDAVNQFYTLKSTGNFGISINYDHNCRFDDTATPLEEDDRMVRRRQRTFGFRSINISDIGGISF